jgi:hypothetical protein
MTVLQDASFATNITGTNAPVDQGDDLEVTFEVQNTGDATDTQSVSVVAGGTNSTNVTLDANRSTTETLTVGTRGSRVGQRRTSNLSVTVSSDDDSDVKDVDIITPPLFEVYLNSTGTSTDVTINRNVTVGAVVTNVGDKTGTQDVNITVGGQTELSQQITLNNSETHEIGLTYPVNKTDDGVPLRVSTENNTLRSSTGRSINVVFTEPLLQDQSFVAPPQNIRPSNGGLSDQLVEDVSGDNDSLDLRQTVEVYRQIFRNELNGGDGLGLSSDVAARKLNWDDSTPKDTVKLRDMVELYRQQFRAQIN